jgi:FtsP/CotA-like multicopper oxidase with cupredoxin domain
MEVRYTRLSTTASALAAVLPLLLLRKGPFPSVTLRMNFSDPNMVGTLLYHCHILKHEDVGIMGSIQVSPSVLIKGIRGIRRSFRTGG